MINSFDKYATYFTDKYGVDTIKESIKRTNLEKYGVKLSLKEERRRKLRKLNLISNDKI